MNLTSQEMPSNRKEVFWDILKLRFDCLIKLGLVLFLSTIPHLINTFFHQLQVDRVFQMMEAEEVTTALGEQRISSLLLVENALNILFLGLIGFVVGGAITIIKRLIWAEGIHFLHDFGKGIRDNGKQAMALFAGLGILLFLIQSAKRGEASSTGRIASLYQVLSIGAMGIGLVLLMPIFGFALSQIAYYEDRLSRRSIVGFRLYALTMPRTLLTILLSLSPLLLILIPNFPIQFVVRIGLVIVVAPLQLLAWMCYSLSVFDRFINRDKYPEIAGKGLWEHNKQK